ncbi:MAG: LVIVD repeat-containing protein, partial [Methyloligellaceae bacterium]
PVSGLNGTHKNYWECETGIAYLVSGVTESTKVPSDPSGYRRWRTHRMTQVFDLGDPANPRFIRNFGIAGQQPGATARRVPQGVHGCISVPARQRVYCGHGTSSDGIVMILDRKELLDPKVEWADRKNPTAAELNAAVVARLDMPKFMGAHTTFPVLDLQIPDLGPVNARRDMLVVVNESLSNECKESRQSVYLVDITDESHPWPVSTFNVGRYNAPGPIKDFCRRGGRFGAHASNESFAAVFYRKLVAVSWFNAGVRLIDIRDPLHPVEAAYFIPRTSKHTTRRDGKIAVQTNNVEVDDRGFVYITDRANTGLHILAVSGDALGSPAQTPR